MAGAESRTVFSGLAIGAWHAWNSLMDSTENQLSCTLNSSCGCVNMLCSMVNVMGHRAALSDKQSNRMMLAVDELFANIAKHGYHGQEGQVDMRAVCEDGKLSFELRDYAEPIADASALCSCSPNVDSEPSPGGLGLQLMCAVMDKIEHEPLADGNRWHLIKYLNGDDDES